MNNPYVRVVQGLPDEKTLNAAVAEELASGAKLMSLSVFGSDKSTGRVVLLFDGKSSGPKRIANDTSAIAR